MRSVRFGLWLGIIGLVGCDGIQKVAQDGPLSCHSDDDCAALPMQKACHAGFCADPGCPLGTAYVGAGPYIRGCDPIDPDCELGAQPLHTVTIDHGFCVSVTELQVQQYRQCVAAGACTKAPDLRCTQDLATWTESPGANEALPLTCLLWSEADAACRFLGGRLPTEAEWEKAARGRDARKYPWGNVQPLGCGSAVNYDGGGSCPGRPWSASSASRQGAQLFSAARAVDMAGNVWEWVTDYYSPLAYRDCATGCIDPLGPLSGTLRSRRGGGFQSSQWKELTTFWRDFHTPESARSDSQGARCIFPK